MNFQTLGDAPQNEGGEADGAEELKDALAEAEPTFGEGEKKKPQLSAEMLGMLGVLVACGAVLYFMYLRNGTPPASAADFQGAAAGATVTDFLSHGEEHVTSMWQSLHNTDKFVEKFHNYPSRPQIPLTDLRTNPFRQTAAQGASTEPESDGAARHRQDKARAEVAKAAEALQLQSVLHGSHNACLINNNLYEQGQQVDGFTVEEITASSVIIRNGAYRFELRIGR